MTIRRYYQVVIEISHSTSVLHYGIYADINSAIKGMKECPNKCHIQPVRVEIPF